MSRYRWGLGRLEGLFTLFVVAALPSCSTAERHPEVSGETHWLAACSAQSACARGQCVCGLCTQTCSSDQSCAGAIDAQCFDVQSPGLLDHCENSVRARGGAVCIATCRADGDCPSGDVCRSGACTPRASSMHAISQLGGACGADSDCARGSYCNAGTCAASSDATALDFLGVDAGSIDFSGAVRAPQSSVTVAGATGSLLGTWQQVECEDCLRLIVERQPDSPEVIAYVTTASRIAVTLDNLPDAVDAGVGYPVGLASRYAEMSVVGIRDYHYRLFDAQLVGQRLSGWFSYFDVWDDWCAMQTPVSIDVFGVTHSVCASDMDDSTVELGKRVLCTSADMSGCSTYSSSVDGRGELSSCAMGDTAQCMRDKQCICNRTISSPLCSPSYCACDTTKCGANLQAGTQTLDLLLDSDRLAGTLLQPQATQGAGSITFMRVSP